MIREHPGALALKRALSLALCGLLVAACGGGESPPRYEKTIAQVTQAIDTQMATNGVTGLSIALVDGQDVVWARGFGFADKESGAAASADTIYEIGSVSKTFAAASIMRLVEQGRVGLDQPLTRYVPAFAINQRFPDSAPITVRSVLTHHSGIPGDLFNGSFTQDQPFGFEPWLLATLKDEYTSAPVGSVLAYSNSAMALLRPVIAAASPGGFTADALDLFDTIGMPNTSYDLDDRVPRARLASAYDAGEKQPLLYCNISTAGCIRSSVRDMAQYIGMLHAGGVGRGGRVLSQASLDEMFRRQNGDAPLDFSAQIGLAWFPETFVGEQAVLHEGMTPWFHSEVFVLPQRQLGVVVLSNSGAAADVDAIARQTIALALQEKTGMAAPASPQPVYSPPDTSWTAAQLQALAGRYVVEGGFTYPLKTIAAVPGGLMMDGQPGPWIPRQNGYFSLPDSAPTPQRVQWKFATVEGRRVLYYLKDGAPNLYGERFEPVAVPAAWAARQGAYTATNINPGGSLWPGTNDVRIDVGSDGVLRVTGTLRGDVVIQPLSDTQAIVAGIGRNRGESVRVVQAGGTEQVELWGYRYRRTGP